MPTPLLQINQLTVTLKKRQALFKAVDNLALTVNKGEILGLVGESVPENPWSDLPLWD